jgi:hypothetical protein
MLSPLLVLHITAGTVGMLSGFVAVTFRKGSDRHRIAGTVFVISMLALSTTGTFLALMKQQPGTVLGGTLTFYLVATAWTTVRRRNAETNIFDWGALLLALTVAATEVTYGLQALRSQTGLRYGYSAGPYFLFASVALIAVAGDVRMLVRRGISGTQRIARHLWRMCFALFIAASSIFLARPHLFPAILRKTGVLVFLSVLPLLLMIFWLIRVRFKNAYAGQSISRKGNVSPLPAADLRSADDLGALSGNVSLRGPNPSPPYNVRFLIPNDGPGFCYSGPMHRSHHVQSYRTRRAVPEPPPGQDPH